MSQQINLLDPSLQPQREWLSLAALAGALAALAVILALAAGLGSWREGREQERFQALDGRLRASQDQLVQLAAEQGRRRADPELAARVAEAEAALAGKLAVMGVLEKGEAGDREGFSGYFQALARQVVDGVWLTGVDMAAGGKALQIRGRMLQESLLPAYVERLNQEPAFQGRRFAALEMRRVDPAKVPAGGPAAVPLAGPARQPYVEFTLGGEAAAQSGAPR